MLLNKKVISLCLVLLITSCSTTDNSSRSPSDDRNTNDQNNSTYPSLDWGQGCFSNSKINPRSLYTIRNSASYQQIISQAKKIKNSQFIVTKKMGTEGMKAVDKGYAERSAAAASVRDVLTVALCAYYSYDVDCINKSKQTILSWVRVYNPTGNPINDRHFVHIFQSYDLLKEHFSKSEKRDIEKWINQFIIESDSFYEDSMKYAAKGVNNWNTIRMYIKSNAAVVTNNTQLFKSISKEIDRQAQDNISSDGKSFDFTQRDSLHYHLFNTQAWLTLLNSTPCVVSAQAKNKIISTIQFMKPYFLKTKSHIEFKNTNVQLDLDRAKSGDKTYQNFAWSHDNPADIKDSAYVLQFGPKYSGDISSWATPLLQKTAQPDLIYNFIYTLHQSYN